jgi:hypothetical protein
LTERYRERLAGVLSCYDRIIVTGTLLGACYAKGMTAFLSARQIRIFDYPRFAEPLRDRVRERAAELASAAGVSIEHLAKNHIRKEDVVAKVLALRGDHPGLVHIISAMEACDSYKPWHDKRTHRTFLRPDSGKCLHYYFYFIDAELGLIYLRVPTWCPFRLQFYCNGHSWLARQLAATGIGFTLADNAFLQIDDWQRAQTLADRLSPASLHHILDRYAQQCCPVLDVFAQSYHWSFMQVEYATDLVFRSQAVLKPLYEQLSRQAILTVKAEHVATFLGHKITPQLAQEIGSQLATRIEGTCVKHRFGKSSIKIYDKFALVLRIETTTNDVSAFKHYRKVEHQQGPASYALAPVKKTSIASPTSVTSCSAATAATSNTSPVWTTSRPVSGRSTVSPNLTRSKAAASGGSTSSATPNRPCFRPSSVPLSISPASGAPTSSHSSPNALPPPSPDASPACANSASSNVSPLPIATISLAPAAPPSRLVAASLNTPSFRLSPDKFAHE